MIADEYFQVRAQLGTAIFSLQTLAHELHSTRDIARTLQDLVGGLRDPFLFVVMGEVKAGKSSLLNALFGRDLCRVDVLPMTDKIYVFKYGAHENDVPVSPTLTECHRPIFLLRDFNIVDTPGTNTIMAEHHTITEQFLPMADLVLFVFSITNPWAGSAWDFLKIVREKWLKNIVFVVQQSDLRNDVEVSAVVKHLKQTAAEKLGAEIPVFAVSAKKGYLAKTSAVDKDRLLSESGLDRLEKYIDDAVAHGESRWGKLRSVCKTCQVILGDLGEKARGAFDIIKQDEQKLTELGLTLEDRKQQSLRQVNGVLWTLSQSYERAQKRGEELLEEKLSFLSTLKLIFRRENWQHDFQEQVEKNLLDAIKRQIGGSADLLENDLKGLWAQLRESLQTSFTSELRQHTAAPVFVNERTELLNKIDLTLLERAANSNIEQRIAKLFEETSTWLRLPAGVAAAGGIATVLAMILAHGAAIDITGSIAAVAAVFGTAVALFKRRQILAQFRTEMVRKREDILAPIEDHLCHAIEAFYQEVQIPLQPLRSFIAAQRNIYDPMVARVKQLEETFGKCASDLGLPRQV